ncbi:hypothetical protein JCM5350_005816 [Sporobolomyces pararoseus]
MSSPQQSSRDRRSYPQPHRSTYSRGSPYSQDPRSRFSDARSPPPSQSLGSELRRQWSPEPLYEDRQAYTPAPSPYRSATTSPSGMFRPQRVMSPDRYSEPPRVTSPTRMNSPPRDFDPNSYQPPRDFNPNETEAGAVRHRNVGQRFPAVDEEEDEKREYQFGTSSKNSNDYTDKTARGSGSDQDLDTVPVLNKNKTTITRGEIQFEDMSEFFAEVTTIQDDIKEANATIELIHNLYARYLACPSSEDVQALALHDQLANKTSSTRGLFASLRNRIHNLEQGNANLAVMVPLGQSAQNLSMSDVSVRQQQVQNIKSRFKDSIQRYAEVEKDNRSKNRAKMERQVRVVYPQLSYEELQQIVRQAEQEGGSALFAQAVRSNGYRSRQAQSALREVQTRAAELGRIEETLTELAQMFADMATLVEAQDVIITKVEDDAREAQLDMEIGLENTKVAVHHARMARKRRWICFFIFVIIVIVLTIVLVLKVILPAVNKNKNNNSESDSSPQVTIPSSGAGGTSNSQGSKGSNGNGGTVTVTVTTTVVVVRQPAQSLIALVEPTSTSRQVLMTVDTTALAAYAKSPLPMFTPSSSSSISLSPSPSPTTVPVSSAISSPRSIFSSPTPRVLAAEGKPSSQSSSDKRSSNSRSESRSSESHSSSRSISNSASSSSRGREDRSSSSWITSTRTSSSPTSSRTSRSESNSHSSWHSGSSSSRPTSSPSTSVSSSRGHNSSSSHSHSHSHSASSSSSKPSSSAVARSLDPLLSARNSPIVTAGHSITSILKALLRRCTSAATPTITF